MTILNQILQQKKVEVQKLKTTARGKELKNIKQHASLYGQLKDTERMNVIAEVKRASPSKGVIRQEVDPVAQAQSYVAAGASAISVLTDHSFFKGSMTDLQAVAKTIDMPLLCKDFIIDEVQIDLVKDCGSSVILLIVAALPETRLRELYQYARSKHLDVLVEVHDESEAEIALRLGARVVGINNRNLKDFTIDLAVTERIAPYFQQVNCVVISESGMKTQADVECVRDAGVKAVLIGEALMRSRQIQQTITQFRIPFSKEVK